jgi:hypothetical protein
MTQLERDLERLFAADARARSVQSIALAPRPRVLPFTALALGASAAALAIVAVLTATGDRSERPAAPPSVPSASPSPSASPAGCIDPLRRQPGDPVVGGSKLAGAAAAGIHQVRVAGGEARWPVILVVGPGSDGGAPVDVAARATLRGPDGPVAVIGYEAGPDEAHTSATTAMLRILPCDSAVLLVRTAAVRSGEYTLTLEAVASGGRTSAVPIFAPLTCTRAGDAQECVNTRGTRATPVPSPPRAP